MQQFNFPEIDVSQYHLPFPEKKIGPYLQRFTQTVQRIAVGSGLPQFVAVKGLPGNVIPHAVGQNLERITPLPANGQQAIGESEIGVWHNTMFG
jgi:hypothetical protein